MTGDKDTYSLTEGRMEYEVHQMNYAWIKYGGFEVYVADITEGLDEKAIMQQIEAHMMGWA